MRELPKLAGRGRLYLATGTPYWEALKDNFNEERRAEAWDLDYSYRPGDLILTVITTSPRMFIALEVARQTAPAGPVEVDQAA